MDRDTATYEINIMSTVSYAAAQITLFPNATELIRETNNALR